MTSADVIRESTLLWLRAEYKPREERTLLTPAVAGKLVAAGFEIIVEESDQRVIPLAEYAAVGCAIADSGSWRYAPPHAIILGLKELPVELGPFVHRHVHFAHVFKQQRGWIEVLQAFDQGGGTLYDLEYLVDDKGRRVAAFGYWAGFVGAALAAIAFAGQQSGNTPSLTRLSAWSNRDALVTDVRKALERSQDRPRVLVIGALGRCGQGAVELCQACDIAVTAWDQQETAVGGPFEAILKHELFINCVFINTPVAPFTHIDHLRQPGRVLRVIADVSCDPFGIHNPVPVYTRCTTLDQPVMRLIEDIPLDIVAIDHLPSLLPLESSEDFATQMFPHLLALKYLNTGIWRRAEQSFNYHIDLMKGQIS